MWHEVSVGELIAASGAKLPSVAIFRLRNMRPERVIRYLHSLLSEHRDALEQGAVVSVTEGQIRVRRLPVEDGG